MKLFFAILAAVVLFRVFVRGLIFLAIWVWTAIFLFFKTLAVFAFPRKKTK
jgi:hypothetical protein